MEDAILSPEDRAFILATSERLHAIGADPKAILVEAEAAETWVRDQLPEAVFRLLLFPGEIAELLQRALPLLNHIESPDPLNCRKFRFSLRGWRIGRLIGTRSEGDEALDTIGDLIAVRPLGPGHPERPLYQRLGDIQEWKLFSKMLDWFQTAQKTVPKASQGAPEILRYLQGQERRDPWFADAFLPSLAQALSRFRRQPRRGGLSAREMTAIWLMEYRTGKEQPDPEVAIRRVERIRKNVERLRPKRTS